VLAGIVLAAWPLVAALARALTWRYLPGIHLLFATTAMVIVLRRLRPVSALLLAVVVYPLVFVGVSVATTMRGLTFYEPPVLAYLFPLAVAAYAAGACGRTRPLWCLPLVLGGTVTITMPWTVIYDNFQVHQWDLFYSGMIKETLIDLRVSDLVLACVTTGGSYLLGRGAARQRSVAEALEQRNAELERLRHLEAEQVVAVERTRIARELHDVIAHHVSAMVIRAQAADRVAGRRPEEARDTVRWIALTGQEALAAMRQIVRVLRSTDGSAAGDLVPELRLADLTEIAARVEAAGLAVRLEMPEPLPVLSPTVEMAAVRIVQEALTNTLVHARGTRAEVSLRVEGGEIALQVDDDGTCGPPGTATVGGSGRVGHGLRGMRERAVSCGGRFEVRAGDLGGWRVSARLPVALPVLGRSSSTPVLPAVGTAAAPIPALGGTPVTTADRTSGTGSGTDPGSSGMLAGPEDRGRDGRDQA